MANWRESAACLHAPTEVFFDDIWPAEGGFHELNLVFAKEMHCHDCPVRRACLEAEMEMERGNEAADRHGLRGFLTPGQREAIEKRGIARCPDCGSMRDPVLLANGILRCPVGCARPDRLVVPPPYNGDQWTKRHTTLSARIVAWIIDNTDVGDSVPPPTEMSEMMGGIRRSDVQRVYSALVDEHTLVRDDSAAHARYSRGAMVAARNWKPNWTDAD